MSTTHHIQSQQIVLSFQGSEREAFGLQERMSQHFQQEMLPIMERVFDQVVGPERHIQLEQLEIDLGQWGTETWSGSDFLRRFAERLESALTTQLGSLNDLVNHSQQANNRLQAWLHFLERGSLPWHQRGFSESDYQEIAEQLSTQARHRQALRALLKRSPKAQQRLFLQHQAPTLRKLLMALEHQLAKQTFALYEFLLAKTGNTSMTPMSQSWEKQYWEAQLQLWIIPIKSPGLEVWQQKSKAHLLQMLSSSHTYFRGLKEELVQKESEVRQTIQSILGSWPISVLVLDDQGIPPSENAQTVPAFGEAANTQETNELEEEADALANQIAEGLQVEQNAEPELDPPNEEVQTPSLLKKRELNPLPSDTRPAVESPGALSEQAGDYFLVGAGVILCHVYLSSFWQRLDWIQMGKFQDLTAQELAVLSLHYLASGEREAPEYQLMLPKLLCGLPLNHPLNVSLTLSEKHAREAENLLSAIVQNWGALGEVSNESLRTGFLQRSGKLSLKSGRWRLLMERQTIDVLLDRLPWSIGIVKLPWMPEPIMVDWN